MDEAALAELMASIRDHGLLQPITVRKVGTRYQVIAGHRRLEAFRRLLADADDQDEGRASWSTRLMNAAA
jgi:ParB/RepB/Spo0J family partition protein